LAVCKYSKCPKERIPRILSKIINGKEEGRPQRKLPKKWWFIVGAVVAHCWAVWLIVGAVVAHW
jgi:hypothetical protein